MRVLAADLALGLDALGPVHDEPVGHAAAVGLPLPPPEGRVSRERPAPRVVVEVLGAAEVVEGGEVLLEVVGHVVEELVLVHRAVRAALGAGAVVRDDHDDGVVQLAQVVQEVQHPSDLVVGVLEEAGEDLHHPGVELALVIRQVGPLLHVGIMAGQLGVLGDDAEFLLTREHLLAIGVPAVVELARVLVGPFLRHLVGGVVGARGEVQEEGLVRCHLLEVGDELDGLVGQVDRQVIALVGRLRRLDLVVVEDEIGIVLVGVAAQEAVVAVESAAQRPTVVRARCADLLGGGQVPLADAEGGVAVREQHLGEEAVLERDGAVGSRVAGRALGDARHGVGVVVAPGQHAGARRRAERRRVHVGVPQTVLRQPVQIGRVDRCAVATELPVTGVVQHDVDHVRSTRFGPQRGGPGRFGLADRASHPPREGAAWLVLGQAHRPRPLVTGNARAGGTSSGP